MYWIMLFVVHVFAWFGVSLELLIFLIDHFLVLLGTMEKFYILMKVSDLQSESSLKTSYCK